MRKASEQRLPIRGGLHWAEVAKHQRPTGSVTDWGCPEEYSLSTEAAIILKALIARDCQLPALLAAE